MLVGWLVRNQSDVGVRIRIISGTIEAVAQMQAVADLVGRNPIPFQVLLIYTAFSFFIVSAWNVYMGIFVNSVRSELIESILDIAKKDGTSRRKLFFNGVIQVALWFIFPFYVYNRGASGVTWQSGVFLSPSLFSGTLIILFSAIFSMFLVSGLVNIFVCFYGVKKEFKWQARLPSR